MELTFAFSVVMSASMPLDSESSLFSLARLFLASAKNVISETLCTYLNGEMN